MSLVTVDKKYEYEVAFSFGKEDEVLATQVNDLIRDRISTFLYSEQQKEAGGNDGIEYYTKKFLDDSRTVVIFYREGWGTTTFTRIEESAIKQRMVKEGLDFTLFVSLDGTKPKWVAPYQIWFDFERFGIKVLHGLIESHIHRHGGLVRVETLEDQQERHTRNIERIKKRDAYLISPQAKIDCEKEKEKFFAYAEGTLRNKMSTQSSISYASSKGGGFDFMAYYEDIGLQFKWSGRYSNTIVDSFLSISFFRIGDNVRHSFERDEKPIKPLGKYLFYLNEAEEMGWVNKDNRDEFKTSKELINSWYKVFFEFTFNEQKKRLATKSGY
jgi:hypothetical protein